MPRRSLIKLGVAILVLVLLLALDAVSALQGLPILLVSLGLALVLTERLRVWLHAQQRASVAMLPFMAASLVLMLAFCRGRNLSQAVLLLVTIGIVFNILLVCLAAIGEVSKRKAKGFVECLGLASLGLVLGLVLSMLFSVEVGRLGGTSLAGP